jgi:hypothetical protein
VCVCVISHFLSSTSRLHVPLQSGPRCLNRFCRTRTLGRMSLTACGPERPKTHRIPHIFSLSTLYIRKVEVYFLRFRCCFVVVARQSDRVGGVLESYNLIEDMCTTVVREVRSSS